MDEGYFYCMAFAAVTGARGLMALSARLPEDFSVVKPGYTISCYDSKRSRPERLTLVMDVWRELGIWAYADGVPPKPLVLRSTGNRDQERRQASLLLLSNQTANSNTIHGVKNEQ